MSVRILAVGGAAVLALASAAHAQSLLFKKGLNKPGKPLKGLVDLHTHPMAHLGFGGHMVHGAPDVGTLMPAGTAYSSRGSIFGGGKNCNEQDVRATSIGEALGSCSATHGGVHGDGNNCGNNVRRLVLSKMGGNPDAHGRDDNDVATLSNPFHPIRHPQGWPSFAAWPKHSDIQHQQMWVDWVKRAYEGGLRVMVALTVNSMTLRKGIAGNTPDDDKTTGDRQIDELKLMVGRHPWMKIASSAADLRRIVAADKLAVIIGSEVDDIGNFAWSMREGRGMPTESQVGAEIQRLWAKGVRYIFPVHVIDNHFGGTAIYEPEFPRASRYHFGRWPSIVCADRRDGITRRISNGADLSKLLALGAAGGAFPLPASCPSGVGYVNSRG
ncbi:MAG TPA: hypothetical protein VNN12_05045, partial [Dehalococcoidia bacterium]|nr:hypothetical protein [Dehalococcoidia bacterium]